MARDPLDPQDLTQEKWHHPQTTRPSTRRGAAAKTAGSLNRADDMNPSRPRRDPYELPLEEAFERTQRTGRLRDAGDTFVALGLFD